MRLYSLSCGQSYVDKAFIWHFGSRDDSGKEYVPESIHMAISQFYIDHPDAKILVDTGWKPGDLGSGGFPQRMGPEGWFAKQEDDENPVAQLEKIGVKLDDIDYVIMSHLHSEHAGWLPDFAGKKAKVILQQRESF